MIESIITSKTRIKLLIKFFLNDGVSSYLRNLSNELMEAPNGVRVELNRLEEAGLLNAYYDGNKKMYMANRNHPLYEDIHNIVIKNTGIDLIVNDILKKLDYLKKAYLTGELAIGKESKLIDIALVGNGIDGIFMAEKIRDVELVINRRIRTIIIEEKELEEYLKNKPQMLIWENKNSETSILSNKID